MSRGEGRVVGGKYWNMLKILDHIESEKSIADEYVIQVYRNSDEQ